jgi:lipopolysaccharide transport system permease protein
VGTAEPEAVNAPEVVISPPGRWGSLNLRELWSYHELVYFLTKRELQVRYKQSFFGVSWAVLQPLALAFIFALLFGTILNLPSEGIPFAVFVVAGVVPWLFTAQAVTASANSLVQDANLISKVYFPRLALPISKALSLTIDLVIAFAVVVVVALLYGVPIASTAVLLPAFVALGLITTFALGSLLAAINVKYRDVELVVPMLVQLLFFLTPVLYPGSAIPGDWRYLYAVNPLSSAFDGIRWALFDTPYPGGAEIAISVASAIALLAVALSFFRRTEHYFADLV